MRKSFGECQLPRLLEQRKMTLTDLSVKTDIAIQQLSDYANNRRTMSLMNASIIADALGCRIEELYQRFPEGKE